MNKKTFRITFHKKRSVLGALLGILFVQIYAFITTPRSPEPEEEE